MKVYLDQDVCRALDAAVDDLLTDATDGAPGLLAALNLLVNAAMHYLRQGWLAPDPATAQERLTAVAEVCYRTDLETILGWLGAPALPAPTATPGRPVGRCPCRSGTASSPLTHNNQVRNAGRCSCVCHGGRR